MDSNVYSKHWKIDFSMSVVVHLKSSEYFKDFILVSKLSFARLLTWRDVPTANSLFSDQSVADFLSEDFWILQEICNKDS